MKIGKFIPAGLLALTVGAAPASAGEVNWRQFEGTSLNILGFAVSYIDAWFRPMAKQFEKETGIKVRLEVLQAGQMRKKQDIMLAGEDETLDVIMMTRVLSARPLRSSAVIN